MVFLGFFFSSSCGGWKLRQKKRKISAQKWVESKNFQDKAVEVEAQMEISFLEGAVNSALLLIRLFLRLSTLPTLSPYSNHCQNPFQTLKSIFSKISSGTFPILMIQLYWVAKKVRKTADAHEIFQCKCSPLITPLIKMKCLPFVGNNRVHREWKFNEKEEILEGNQKKTRR